MPVLELIISHDGVYFCLLLTWKKSSWWSPEPEPQLPLFSPARGNNQKGGSHGGVQAWSHQEENKTARTGLLNKEYFVKRCVPEKGCNKNGGSGLLFIAGRGYVPLMAFYQLCSPFSCRGDFCMEPHAALFPHRDKQQPSFLFVDHSCRESLTTAAIFQTLINNEGL